MPADAEPVAGASGSVADTNWAPPRKRESPTTACSTSPAGPSVWFVWTAPIIGWRTFNLCDGAAFDSLMSAYTGTAVATLIHVTSDDDTCGRQSQITFNTTAGG